MGSTQGQRAGVVHSINVATNLIALGRFKEADKELTLIGSPNKDVAVLQAICDYRLGDETALERLEERYDNSFTIEQAGLVFRHEILGHISAKPRRFSQAIGTLQEEVDDVQYKDLDMLLHALRILHEGKRSSFVRIGHKHYRAGLTASAYDRVQYLNDAFKLCQGVADKYVQDEGEPVLIRIISVYLLLLIEMSMSPHIRNNAYIKRLRRELYSVDEGVRKSLPPRLIFKLVQYRTTFA